MANVVFSHVGKRFGEVQVIDDLNLEINDHEFIVLVGPSGCGKSTALRMIAGLEDVSQGTISIGGRVVNDLPPKDRDIAMVFQSYALYPHMTVRQNLGFGLEMRKTPRAEIDRLVSVAADILDITPLLDRKPKQLSGGQRQRVAVGRAIVRNPEVFLFDEPLSNLDAKLRVQMRAEIRKLHRRLQTTAVYVTHDQIEAMTMGDRIVVLNAGRIQQIGPPLEVYDTPANVFVAQFIGTPPMNFFAATLENVNIRGEVIALPAPERLRGSPSRRLVVGIRPEHLHEAKASGDGHSLVDAEVELVEPIGHAAILHARTTEGMLVAVVKMEKLPAAGSRIRLGFDPERVHLFDAESELRL